MLRAVDHRDPARNTLSRKANKMARWRLAAIDDGQADWRHAVAVITSRWPLHTLTRRQRQIIRYLAAYQTQHHNSPTWTMIADECGLRGPSTVGYHLHRLQELGWIHMPPNRRASIQLIEPSEHTVVLPPLAVST